MKEDKSVINVGSGFLGMLTVLFIGLKLTGHIDWSWWWVLSPLWLPVAVVLGIIAIVVVIAIIIDRKK